MVLECQFPDYMRSDLSTMFGDIHETENVLDDQKAEHVCKAMTSMMRTAAQ